MERASDLLEWNLNNPLKPHSFLNLPLQSSFTNSEKTEETASEYNFRESIANIHINHTYCFTNGSGSSIPYGIEDEELIASLLPKIEKRLSQLKKREDDFTRHKNLIKFNELKRKVENHLNLHKEIIPNQKDIGENKWESLKQAASESHFDTDRDSSPCGPVHPEQDFIPQNDVSTSFYEQFFDLVHNLLKNFMHIMSPSLIHFCIII